MTAVYRVQIGRAACRGMVVSLVCVLVGGGVVRSGEECVRFVFVVLC